MDENLIYVLDQDVPKTKTRKGFLKKFLATVPATYFAHNDQKDCEASRKRSVSDLHLLTQSRFKKTSLKAVCRILGELSQEGLIATTYCGTIQKVVVMCHDTHYNGLDFHKKDFITSYGRKNYYNIVGVDNYSLESLEEIMKKECYV